MGMGTHTWVGGPLAIRPLPPLRKGVESREAWVDTLEPAARPFQPFSLSSHQPTKPPTASTHNICQPPTGWRRSTKIFTRFWQICSNSISDLSSICLRSFQFQGTPLVLSFLHHFAKFNIQTLSTPTTWLNLGYIHHHDISHKLISAMQQCNNVLIHLHCAPLKGISPNLMNQDENIGHCFWGTHLS